MMSKFSTTPRHPSGFRVCKLCMAINMHKHKRTVSKSFDYATLTAAAAANMTMNHKAHIHEITDIQMNFMS